MLKAVAGLILSLLVTGGSYAFKAIVFDIPAAKADVQVLKQKQDKVDEKLERLLEDTAKIKGVLGVN